MIKFFRSIRKKLAADSNFNAYMRYAIGEIVLVVLGILIALQLNNWNEERKLKQTGVIYMEAFYQDLKKDTLLLSEMLKDYKIKVTLLDEMNLCYDSIIKSLPHNQCLKNLYMASQSFWELNSNDGTIQQLKNTGSMESLNKEDIVKILDYEIMLSNYKLDEKTVYQESQTMLRNIMDKIIDFEAINNPEIFENKTIHFENKNLINEYFNVLIRYQKYSQLTIEKLDNINSTAKEIIYYLKEKYNFN